MSASGPYPTKSGKQEIRWREGSRHRSKSFTSKRAAARFRNRVSDELELGRPIILRRDAPTLHDFAMEQLEAHVARKDLARNTALWNAGLMDVHIDPFIGHLPLVDLTARRLDEWQREALEAGTPYMIQRATQLLCQILDAGVRQGYLLGNPARSLEKIKHVNAEGTVASPLQVELMRAWFLERDRIGDATLVSAMAYGGFRVEEVFALHWRNQRARRFYVEKKNVDGRLVAKKPGDKKRGPRWVDLCEALFGDFAEWRLSLGRPAGLVFPRAIDDQPWTKTDRGNWRNRWFKPAAAAAGLITKVERDGKVVYEGRFQPRDLRRTWASVLAAVNTPRIEIEAQLGHRADTSERIYQRPIEELRGTRLSVDEIVAQARAEVFGDGEDVRSAFGSAHG